MAEENTANQTATEQDTGSDEQVKTTEQETKDTSPDVQKQVDEARKQTLREASKKLGVNLFDDKEVETFLESQKNKVDKSEYEKLQERVKEAETLKQERDNYALENAIIKHNVQEDYRDKVEKLAKLEMSESDDLTYDKAVEKVVADMPFFTRKAKKAGVDINDDNSKLDGNDAYVRKNYKQLENGSWVKKT